MRKSKREGSGLWVLTAVMALLALVPFLGLAADHADTPTTIYRATLASTYFRGRTAILSADSSPATTYTTGATYTDGVQLVSFVNPTARVIYITVDGTAASATNYQIVLPATSAFTEVRQQKITQVQAYAASASTIYVHW